MQLNSTLFGKQWTLNTSIGLSPRVGTAKNKKKRGGFKQQKHPLRVLEASSPKSRRWQDQLLMKATEEFVLCSSPSFWQLPASLSTPWLIDTWVTPISTRFFTQCPSLLFCVRVQGHISLGPTLIQSDLILTQWHPQSPMSEEGGLHTCQC